MYRILKKRQLTPVTALYVIDAPLVARTARPGQFVILRVDEGGERIPVTITDFDPEAGTVTIVVQQVGKTTHWLAQHGEGDTLADFAGPLGTPVALPDRGRVALVGGGFGAAAILTIAKELAKRPEVTVDAIVGARTASLLILSDEVGAVVDRFLPCTDDGSRGYHGLVTGLLEQEIAAVGYDLVMAIGPMPMMRAVAEVTRPHGIPTYASMDPIMLDGTGMCGACRVRVGGQNRFACVDGPFFDAHQVDFDEVTRRNKMYRHEERLALERWHQHQGSCATVG
ncbi:ferredoxin--NADP+ reductase [Symbiobacterium terraclitae]|uniref:Ferredoxin--NADP+ reductase n=1 Tax=Symbiobacterium terraclitae TaxID=557451 RepID=A0ABS4JRD7_9FIRM|nr:sulfide/dihydroorotate dehydrogenase-like FAD/NAD-binding protein [Symbiobacterium terraclitae]MBP2018095.1 ferredoxin--NADP+ reductase [Symbiobacterium terraclitae]